MKFIDLFAGLGGFNISLSKFGGECVFASEIDRELQELYKKNYAVDCAGDITQVDARDIPNHDILCAGFPCQPFSKAGKRKGLSDIGRGDMISHICRILNYHQPKYFILENVPNIKTHDDGCTWKKIITLLSSCNYQIKDSILSPHHFSVPHKRERIFIVGTHNRLTHIPFRFPSKNKKGIVDMKKYLEPDRKSHKQLTDSQLECLETWNDFLSSIPNDKPIPKFPIWAMEFGATYPLDEQCPYFKTQKELENYRGAFGCSLKGLNKTQQISKLPVYARYEQKFFPKWKINYINKNRIFWAENKTHLKHLLPKLKTYINSWQKLEWNAGEGERDIYKHLLQFRSSGIRVKSSCSVPSLVLTGTQTPIIGWKKRYISLHEAQKFQGFETITMPTSPAKGFAALGNAVNTQVVEKIVEQFINSQNKPVQTFDKHSFTLNNISNTEIV